MSKILNFQFTDEYKKALTYALDRMGKTGLRLLNTYINTLKLNMLKQTELVEKGLDYIDNFKNNLIEAESKKLAEIQSSMSSDIETQVKKAFGDVPIVSGLFLDIIKKTLSIKDIEYLDFKNLQISSIKVLYNNKKKEYMQYIQLLDDIATIVVEVLEGKISGS